MSDVSNSSISKGKIMGSTETGQCVEDLAETFENGQKRIRLRAQQKKDSDSSSFRNAKPSTEMRKEDDDSSGDEATLTSIWGSRWLSKTMSKGTGGTDASEDETEVVPTPQKKACVNEEAGSESGSDNSCNRFNSPQEQGSPKLGPKCQ